MLEVLADGPRDEAEAAKAAAPTSTASSKELVPADHALTEEIHHDEQHVDHYNDKHLLFELAEVGLEVGIVLSTVSIIAHRRWLLAGGAAVGIIGTVLLVAGAVTVCVTESAHRRSKLLSAHH